MSRDNFYHYPLNEIEPITDLKQMIEASSKKYANRAAFVYQDEVDGPLTTVTYKKYQEELEACAMGLAHILKIDIEKRDGKKIALIAPNSYWWTLAYFATVNTNQVIVPMDWQLPVRDLVNLIKRAGVSNIFFAGVVDSKIKELKKELLKIKHYIALDESDEATMTMKKIIETGKKQQKINPDFYQNIKINPEIMCTLIFTSGTTSLPKGVMLTQRNFCSNIMNMCQLVDYTDETLMSILPLHHSYEFTLGLIGQLYRGTTIYYLAGGLTRFAENLQIVKPTLLMLVPLIAEGSYKRILASLEDKNDAKALHKAAKKYFGGRLKKFMIGGAPLNPVIADSYEETGVKILQGYGITECSPAVALNRDFKYKFKSCGMPLPNTKVKIIDKNEDGIGEVIVRSPSVMLGYYKDQRKTDEVLKNNWFYTGDYGYYDDDNFLFIAGRKKNVILGKNAKNIYPEELEFLLNNTPGIAESMVYGKVVDDDVKAAALIAVNAEELKEIEPEIGEAMELPLVEKVVRKIIRKINKENAEYKAIVDFQIVSSIPRTSTGKIKRN